MNSASLTSLLVKGLINGTLDKVVFAFTTIISSPDSNNIFLRLRLYVYGNKSGFLSPLLRMILSGDLFILLATNENSSQTVVFEGRLTTMCLSELLDDEIRFVISIFSMK